MWGMAGGRVLITQSMLRGGMEVSAPPNWLLAWGTEGLDQAEQPHQGWFPAMEISANGRMGKYMDGQMHS